MCQVALVAFSFSASANAELNEDAQRGDGTIQEIVVTAARTETALSKTPVAASVIQGDQLVAQGIASTENLTQQVPGLVINRNFGGYQVTIRGVTTGDLSEKGDPSAAVMLDGIYLARPQVVGISMFDVTRVEVLRGPQGTLYGRNSTAGVVNIIPNKPEDNFGASANFTYGNFDTIQAQGMINAPLSSNLAIRFAGSLDYRDSFLQTRTPVGPVTPGTIFYELGKYKKNQSARVSLLWEPAENLKVDLSADYAHIGGNQYDNVQQTRLFDFNTVPGQILPTHNSSKLRRTLDVDVTRPASTDSDSLGVRGEVTLGLGAIDLIYLGSFRDYQDVTTRQTGIFRGTGYVGLIGFVDASYRQQSHEVRLVLKDVERLQAQLGGYYFNEENSYKSMTVFPAGIFAPIELLRDDNQRSVSGESYAVFGQVTYALLEDLRLTAGGRYSNDDKAREGRIIIRTPGPFPPGSSTPFVVSNSLNDARFSSGKVTWRFGIDYDLSENTLLFGTVSTGYKAGSFNDGCLVDNSAGSKCPATIPGLLPSPVPGGPPTPGLLPNGDAKTESQLFYQPETLTSYEAGFKTLVADYKLGLNGTVFYYDYAKYQLLTADSANPFSLARYINADAKIWGVELEGLAFLSRNDSFRASFSYTHSKFTDSEFTRPPLASAVFKGRPLDRAPQLTVSGNYMHRQPLGSGDIVFNLGTRLSAKYYINDYISGRRFLQPSFTKSDLSFGYEAEGQKWFVTAFIRNIEDTVEVTQARAGQGGVPGDASVGDPRTYGITAGFKF
jgi:iron complex outermembrane receptor protein